MSTSKHIDRSKRRGQTQSDKRSAARRHEHQLTRLVERECSSTRNFKG